MDSGPIVLKSKDRPRNRKKDNLITQHQAEKAAAQCGMVVAKISGLKNQAAIGKYIEQLGATQISRSTILIVQHKAQDDLEKIDQFIRANDGAEICLIMDLYKLKAIYSDIVLRSAQAQMKLKGDTVTVNTEAPVMLAFPPGTASPRLPESACVESPNVEDKRS